MTSQRQRLENSSKRYGQVMDKFKNVGKEFSSSIKDSQIKAEYDTWSWYYSELSNLRAECSRLGLYVRINDSSSPNSLMTYHAHIYSFLQMIMTVCPYTLADNLKNLWQVTKEDIDKYFNNRKLTGLNLKIPDELIMALDLLYDTALKVAQEIGLGFKITLNRNTADALSKRLLGE